MLLEGTLARARPEWRTVKNFRGGAFFNDPPWCGQQRNVHRVRYGHPPPPLILLANESPGEPLGSELAGPSRGPEQVAER